MSGTCIGGGTFWGLCRLLTACRDFDEAMELSQTGDPSKCDMLVGDIYGMPLRPLIVAFSGPKCHGFSFLAMIHALRAFTLVFYLSLHLVARTNGLAGGSYEKFGLSASIVASAFGKMIMKDAPRAADVTDADIARSLLNMVGHNIAQLAYVFAF